MVAVDIDGCDLASDDRTRRIDWAAPVRDASDVRAELIRQLANSGA
jgi:heme iron utilization protein